MDDKGEVTAGREEYRKSWAGVIEKFDIELLDNTPPEIVFSKDKMKTLFL